MSRIEATLRRGRAGPRASHVLREFLGELLDAVFPAACLVCGAAAGPVAWACARHALPDPARDDGERCPRCAGRMPPFAAAGAECPACRADPPPLARLVVLGDYAEDAPLRDWILALKHGARRDLAEPLGRALALRLQAVRGDEPGSDHDVLVPVPLHPLRRFERGYDQAALLAEAASAASGLPVRRALRRVRATPSQGAPGCGSRIANLRGAIAMRRGASLGGARVWLVDDVATSGATLAACAAAARRGGAREVRGLVLARAGEALRGRAGAGALQ